MRSKFPRIILILVLLFLIGPFFIIFIASFGGNNNLNFPPDSFSLKWFEKVISMSMFRDAFFLSLRIGLLASLFAMILGVPVAYITSRYNFFGKRVIEFVTTLPVIIPQMVAGLALMRYFVNLNIFSIEVTLLIGHVAIVIPFVIRNVLSTLVNFPSSMEDAAVSLGSSRVKSFFLIVLPNISAGLISAFILTFITSFNNVPISLFLTGPGVSTLPIVMMTYMEYYYDPSIAALSTLLIGITVLIVLSSQKLLNTSKYM